MRANLNASDRVILLLSLIPYVQDRGPTPITELAETFSVAAEELRALAEFLGTAGVPGETQTYQHEDLFDIDWNALEYDDVLSLVKVVAVDDTPRFAASETAALLAGLYLLAPMLPEADAAAARSAALKLGGEAGGEHAVLTVSDELNDPQFAAITGAIGAGVRLAFRYRDASGGATSRIVDPLHLSQNGALWYLRGYCLDRLDERSFRLDRMTGTHALSESAVHRPSASRPGETPDASVWSGTHVTLRVRESALSRLSGYGAKVMRAGAKGAASLDAGWLRVRVELAHVDTAARLAAVAPGEIVVEAPDAARESVAAWAERALAQYDA